MPRILGKKLQFCFLEPKDPNSSPKFTSTPFSQNDHNHLSTSASTMKKLENLNHIPTFYDLPSSSSTSKSFTPSTSEFFSSDSDSDTHITTAAPDLATIFASQRFFISSPGLSNSILESIDLKEDALPPSPTFPESIVGGIPMTTYSPDPYIDFRQSMVEMIEANELFNVKEDWDSIHKLLLCYLALNPKDTHKYIIAAFTDVFITTLTPSVSETTTRRKSDVSDYCSVSSRLVQ
ncbi:Transcription repressor ofp12 [Thalictrum thalictroides]|uniref:Transcription repressor n=1 Tax=Thalictrum thalictroides TaxID=46969 RepID=A0A7J6VE90_THATH|nr:Transcription repressor ofp12 [Thalictrum thalictroides]